MNVVDVGGNKPRDMDEKADASEQRAVEAVVQAIGRTWKFPVLLAVVTFVIGFAGLAAIRSALPTTTTYLARVSFVFPEVASSRYPNEAFFSINELIDPTVLSAVYDKLQLDQFKLRREEFLNGFSVRPYAPTEDETAERFRQLLADRRLTFVERERIEDQLKRALELSARSAAEITFTRRGRFPLPDEVGRAIMQAIPQTWAENAIKVKGVLRMPAYSAAEEVISPTIRESASLPTAIIMLSEATYRLNTMLLDLRTFPGILTARETTSGKSLQDLQQDARNNDLYRLNRLRAALGIYDFGDERAQLEAAVQRRLKDIQEDEINVEQSASAIGRTVDQYVASLVGLKGRPGERSGSKSTGSTVIPQISEGVLDRIIDLSGRPDENARQFILAMTRRQLGFNERAVILSAERRRWNDVLASLSLPASERQPLTDAAREELEKNFTAAVTELNRIWRTLGRLHSEFALNRIGATGNLYSSYAVKRDIITSSPVWNSANLVMTALLTLVVFLLTWAVRAAVYWRRRRGPEFAQ